MRANLTVLFDMQQKWNEKWEYLGWSRFDTAKVYIWLTPILLFIKMCLQTGAPGYHPNSVQPWKSQVQYSSVSVHLTITCCCVAVSTKQKLWQRVHRWLAISGLYYCIMWLYCGRHICSFWFDLIWFDLIWFDLHMHMSGMATIELYYIPKLIGRLQLDWGLPY